eukprot:m.25646 g.25646  ORF g.25646 m.25646 type:complete len:57 (+) comp15108_c0_seq1:311-481(+)
MVFARVGLKPDNVFAIFGGLPCVKSKKTETKEHDLCSLLDTLLLDVTSLIIKLSYS